MLPTSSRWISIHKTLTSLDQLPENHIRILEHFNPQGSHESRRAKSIISLLINWFQSTRLSRASTMIILSGIYWLTNFNPQGSHEPRRCLLSGMGLMITFQSTRLSRASTAKIHNYPCIHAKFIYLNYTPSTNHPASQKIFSYFNPIFRPFAVRIPLEFYVQLLLAPELPY